MCASYQVMSDDGACRISSANDGGERVSSVSIRHDQSGAEEGWQLTAGLAFDHRAKELARGNKVSIVIFRWSVQKTGPGRREHYVGSATIESPADVGQNSSSAHPSDMTEGKDPVLFPIDNPPLAVEPERSVKGESW